MPRPATRFPTIVVLSAIAYTCIDDAMEEPKPISVLRQCPTTLKFITVGGRGGTYTVKVRESGRGIGVEFLRDGGGSKSLSGDRFMRFWNLWSSGERDLNMYRNESGQCSRAAVANYALPVFEWIARRI